MITSFNTLVAPLIWCLLFCISLNVLLRPAALRLGLVDVPGGRKQHTGRIPLIGGISIMLAFCLGTLLLDTPYNDYAPLLTGMLLLMACGLVDDMWDMRSTVKLLVQVQAAVLMIVWGGLVVRDVGAIPGLDGGLGVWGLAFTLVTVVGLINAINMMDGVDGLAGGVVLGAMFWLGVLAVLNGQETAAVLVLTLAVCVMGFLVFNIRHPWRPRATVFLGDAGSLVLGFALAWFAVEIAQGGQRGAVPGDSAAVSPFAVAWVLALPVMDTMSLMYRRLRSGRSPFSADREHLHHKLQRTGFGLGTVSVILVAANFMLGGMGIAATALGVPDILQCMGLLLLFAWHAWFVNNGWRELRMLRRLRRLNRSKRSESDPLSLESARLYIAYDADAPDDNSPPMAIRRIGPRTRGPDHR